MLMLMLSRSLSLSLPINAEIPCPEARIYTGFSFLMSRVCPAHLRCKNVACFVGRKNYFFPLPLLFLS